MCHVVPVLTTIAKLRVPMRFIFTNSAAQAVLGAFFASRHNAEFESINDKMKVIVEEEPSCEVDAL